MTDTDGLRERIAEVLRTTTSVLISGYPTIDPGVHGETHTFHAGCALCHGEADTLAAAVLPLVEAAVNEQTGQLRAELAKAQREVRRAQGSENWMSKHLASQDQRVTGLTSETHKIRADRDRLAAEVAELRTKLARLQQSRRNLWELLEHHRDMGSLGMLRQHRNRLARALRACARYRAELAETKQDAGGANAEGQQQEALERAQLWKQWKGYAEQLQTRLAEVDEGITAAVQARKTAEDRARKAEAEVARLIDLTARYADRGITNGQNAEIATWTAVRAIQLMNEAGAKRGNAEATVARLRAEATRALDLLDRSYTARGITVLRTALDGTEETPGPWVVRKICCGSDDGTVEFPTWTEADSFRETYIDSAQVAGHERSAIIRAKEVTTGE